MLLAIPTLSLSRRRQIVDAPQAYGIPVMLVPSAEEITSGRGRIDALRPIAIQELLGRAAVPPRVEPLGPGIRDASVFMGGAGGSIGSELCRQILWLMPKRLLLFERSKPSLYVIHQELSGVLPAGVALVPVLGSAADWALVERCFTEHTVDVVFHAAAYKHVPLVEANPLAGLANNVLSTKVVCDAARCCGAAQLVLISTYKAVRPHQCDGRV